ncbi:ArsR/SmtB family transcription factor [Pontivivens insulae]|uniref:HTH-type transcriptional regulator CmtR n=1 Tax=Pontivivens insulae TaxID=1639689 RepID=A0A2R8AFP5_9RHOB|nr:winged helix-turn-helix domain-containing protein [Pontivivens insulae]RED12294.1 ArsR family transcriptional regulator [Pontivivens insulae]SPF31051.1 HTH-type transcriptional regulator CmtR [Pontivivens insulae]
MTGPNIAHLARLIGDPARALMLAALMDGRALTAGELAEVAGITRQTASTHLAQLRDGGLLEGASQGKHRYFRLASAEVADILERLMALSGPVKHIRTGPRNADMRAMRVCYDHLAGPMAVRMAERMQAKGWLDSFMVPSVEGNAALSKFGIDLPALHALRRPFVRPCLDWSERRDHIAGALGAALLERMITLGWMRREPDSRIMRFAGVGEAEFERWLR